MRRLVKFLHSIGAIGLIGAIACLLVLLSIAPQPDSIVSYALIRGAMGTIATWIFFPSLGMTLIAGLLAIAFSRGYQNSGWAWAKAASGILIFEAGFVGVLGPMQREAEQSAKALAGEIDLATLATAVTAEKGTLWVLLAISVFNVAFGIWRPRLTRLPD